MPPNLRKRPNAQLTDVTREHALQTNARATHVPETKALSLGMRAPEFVAPGTGNKENDMYVPGIAERAKQRRRKSSKESSYSPSPPVIPAPRRRQSANPRLQKTSLVAPAEMSVATPRPAALPPPEISPLSPALKRKSSFDDFQQTSPKRSRSSSAHPTLQTNALRWGYGFTSPSILTSMTWDPLLEDDPMRRSSRGANPLLAPDLVADLPREHLTMLAGAAAAATTESLVVKLPVAHPTPAVVTYLTAVDASPVLKGGDDDVGESESTTAALAAEETSLQAMDDATDVPKSSEHDADGRKVINSSPEDYDQPIDSTVANPEELNASAEITSPDVIAEKSLPSPDQTEYSATDEVPETRQVNGASEQEQPRLSTPVLQVTLSLSPQAASRAKDVVARTPANSPPAPAISHSRAPPLTIDEQFVTDTIHHLERQSRWKTRTVAKDQARRMLEVLTSAKEPNNSEALSLSSAEARKYLETNTFFPGPIFVDNAQPMELGTVQNFLSEYYDDSVKVWIQDPSILVSRNKPHAREVTIKQLKERFAQGKPKIPWNCLELAAHVEDGLRPAFLNSEDCRLLTKLKIPSSEDHTSRRGFDAGYKEVEKWALLAQPGSLTSPHQDSHGYSTYITVNQGTVGFGWLSHPTAAQRTQWLKNPSTFKDGNWRYKILRPGQTVYFPNGTVHFVFRLHSAGDTLAFGGHVLRCSQIVSWVKTLIEERAHRDVTNEDITVSAPGYLERVARFVKQARRLGQEEKWGGAQAITEFLRLKDKFMGM